jgi:hypothetical protein
MGLLHILRVAQQVAHRLGEQRPARRRWSVGPQWRQVAPDGRELKVSYEGSRRGWTVTVAGDSPHRASRLRAAVAEATNDDPNASWIVGLETEIEATLDRAR